MVKKETVEQKSGVLQQSGGINPIAAFALLALGLSAFGYVFMAFPRGSSAATSLASSTQADEIAATDEVTAAWRTPDAAAAASGYAVAPFTHTYTNPIYGFSFQYPDGLAIGEWTDPSDNGDATTVLIQNVQENVFFQVDITPWGDPQTPLTAPLIEELAPQLQVHDARPITVGGVDGMMFSTQAPNQGDSVQVWFVHDGALYQTSTYAEQLPLLFKILATWMFAE
jgi:hypothetical protein